MVHGLCVLYTLDDSMLRRKLISRLVNPYSGLPGPLVRGLSLVLLTLWLGTFRRLASEGQYQYM